MKAKIKKWLLIGAISIPICLTGAFLLACLVKGGFKLVYFLSMETALFFLLLIGTALVLCLWYYCSHYWLYNARRVMKGQEKDKNFDGNLEQSRFQTEEEIQRNFENLDYAKLPDKEIIGTMIRAEEKDGRLTTTFAKPSHVLVIGTTGSGKTTSYVSPSIQVLSNTKTKPSMLISDPKGELCMEHAKALEERGYEVKVLDLRNPYNSIRWNPLERPYELYQKAFNLDKEVIPNDEMGFNEFEGREYYDIEELKTAKQVKKQQLLDEVYEDLNDICTVLSPVINKGEPMWESGSKNFILAIALAMLEDSQNPDLKLTKDKFNFFSITKLATSTDDDCQELIDYFRNRDPLSRCVSLAKQVLDSSDKTRGSYLSTIFDKLNMFSDMSLCALTSSNEIDFSEMGERPIALFLQIPDEKETRHSLASMVILQAYKALVARANKEKNLTLPRPVYFILDEFGNLPKVHKLEQMITVGRSRNIWMNLIVQSYSQLSKVYDEKSADIIKSNCNVQIFIGTTDLKTIEDFSKRCGNFSVVQRSVGFSSSQAKDISSNASLKERPLIYPSELQRLNSNGNMGNAIVTVFGYFPIRAKFTPSYKCSFYDLRRTQGKLGQPRFFDEANAFYDLRPRNRLFNPTDQIQDFIMENGKEEINDKPLSPEQIMELEKKTSNATLDLLNPTDATALNTAIRTGDKQKALRLLNKAREKANYQNDAKAIELIKEAIDETEKKMKQSMTRRKKNNEKEINR